MLRRPYGKTGDELSIIGFGGIIVSNMDQPTADNHVAEAIEAGVNYFDVAPSYGDAEDQLGPALKPYRNQTFLACKTTERKKSDAERELHQSLRKLQTDHFDLYQLHAMTTEEDFQVATGPNGALEAIVAAKQKGLIRNIGFSAHSVDIALKLIDIFDFQSVLLPINFAAWFKGNFGQSVVTQAKDKGMAILALKAMAKQLVPEGGTRPYERCWYEPIDDPTIAQLAVRWTLSQDTTAAIPPGDMSLFRIALKAAIDFKPITVAEEQQLADLAHDKTPVFSNN